MGSTEKSSGSVALRHSFLQTLQPSSDVADGVSPVSQPRFVPDADFKLLSDRVEDFVVEHAADTQVQDALWRTDCKAAFCDGLQADESSQSGQRNANFRKVEETPSMMVDTLCKFTYSTHIHIIHALQNAE